MGVFTPLFSGFHAGQRFAWTIEPMKTSNTLTPELLQKMDALLARRQCHLSVGQILSL